MCRGEHMCDHSCTCPRLLFFCQTPIYSSSSDLLVHLKCSKRLTLPFYLPAGNETYYSGRGRVTLKPNNEGVPNVFFVIEEAVMGDRGSYSCSATSANNSTDSATVYVRVKGKECSMLGAVLFSMLF